MYWKCNAVIELGAVRPSNSEQFDYRTRSSSVIELEAVRSSYSKQIN
ncbi:MAG: hypothetical protein LBF19_03975 [Prevotellaceae bacterium]|nr:hypothetical protein [Prevotellaceae bacterium]